MHPSSRQLLAAAQERRRASERKKGEGGVAVAEAARHSHTETDKQQPQASAAHMSKSGAAAAAVGSAVSRVAGAAGGSPRPAAAGGGAAPAATATLVPGVARSSKSQRRTCRASVSSTAPSNSKDCSTADEVACNTSSGEEGGVPVAGRVAVSRDKGSSNSNVAAAGRNSLPHRKKIERPFFSEDHRRPAEADSDNARAPSRRVAAASPPHTHHEAAESGGPCGTDVLQRGRRHSTDAAPTLLSTRKRLAARARLTEMGTRQAAAAAERPPAAAAAAAIAAEEDTEILRQSGGDGEVGRAETGGRRHQASRDAPRAGRRSGTSSSRGVESQEGAASSSTEDRNSSRKGNCREKGGSGRGVVKAAAGGEGTQPSKRFQTLLRVENPNELPDELVSDEEEDENRIGDVPLWWYDALDHIGYNSAGEPLRKKEGQLSQIEKLLAKSEGGEGWRTVFDVKNNRTVRLTDTDLEIIRRVHAGAFPLPSFREDEFYIESDREDSIFPMHNKPEPKRRFLPSQHEQRKITRLVALIRAGKLPQQRRDAAATQQQIEVFDMWKADVHTQHSPAAAAARGSRGPLLRAPKLPLPGHAESYNPPEEFLFTPEEEREWREMEAADRPLSFLPRRYAALRHVGAFQDLLLERFNRCLDLYLCPRAVKLRMNVDPASLLPELPPLQELKPFPTAIRIDFLPVAAYAQLQLLPRRLNTLPAAVAAPLLPLPLPAAAAAGGGAAGRDAEAHAEEENLLRLACNYISQGVSGVSIDPSGTWLAVGENIISSSFSSSTAAAAATAGGASSAAAAARRGGGEEEQRHAPARLWIFEISTGKPLLSFDLQQHVTALAFHPRLPMLAVAVEEQLLLLVLDLPLFDASKLLTLTAAGSSSSSQRGLAGLTQKKQRRVSAPSQAAAEAGSRSQEEAQQDGEDEDDAAAADGQGQQQMESRRALLEEAAALLRDVGEWAAAGDAVEGDGETETGGQQQQQDGAAAEEETPGARRRRQQQQRGAVGEWRQIRVKGIATAPATAGTAGRESKKQKRLLQQPTVVWPAETADVKNKEKKEKKKEKEEEAAAANEEEEVNDASHPCVSAPLGGLLCGVSIIHDSTIRCLSWHHKGGYLVAVCPGSASPAQQCSVHSLKKKKTIHPLRKAPGGRMQAAAFHPTKPCLVLAYPKAIRIINLQRRGGGNDEDDDARNRKLIGAENVCCVEVHPKGMQIVAGGGDRSVYVFDLDLSPRVYKTLRSHAGAVISVGLHPRYPLLFTASHDGTVQLFHFRVYDDLLTNPLIIPIRKLRATGKGKTKVTACAWHPTQPWLVMGDSAGECSLWG